MDFIVDSQVHDRLPEKFGIGQAKLVRLTAIGQNAVLIDSQSREVRGAHFKCFRPQIGWFEDGACRVGT